MKLRSFPAIAVLAIAVVAGATGGAVALSARDGGSAVEQSPTVQFQSTAGEATSVPADAPEPVPSVDEPVAPAAGPGPAPHRPTRDAKPSAAEVEVTSPKVSAPEPKVAAKQADTSAAAEAVEDDVAVKPVEPPMGKNGVPDLSGDQSPDLSVQPLPPPTSAPSDESELDAPAGH